MWFFWAELLCGLLLTMEHGRSNESLWVMATLTCCQPDEDMLQWKVCWNCSRTCAAVSTSKGATPNRNVWRSTRAPNVSLKVCVSFSNDPTSSFKISPASFFFFFPLDSSCCCAKAELSQRELYCNQLFSSGIQTPDGGIPMAHHRPNQTL